MGTRTRRKTGPAALPAGLYPLIGREDLARRVAGLGAEIARRVRPAERPVAVVVLQGAFVFAADLIRHLPPALGLEIGFLRCESYGTGTVSQGRVVLLQDLDAAIDLRGRTVLLIDDILDTGLTLRYLIRHLTMRGAGRVRVCVLLRRKGAKQRQGVKADFCGFDIGPDFVVGYGLDHAGRHRNLPDLAAVHLEKPAARSIPAKRKRSAP
ncbi:MAG: hypoxanthine phosphoribosyltransferase [Planctomycetota bacterium]|nr:hypoxanthine phosphoribosyltransferase [Planctomycetota bacterium]